MFLIIGFMLGLTAGFTVLTAQRFGAGDMKSMKNRRQVRQHCPGNYDGNCQKQISMLGMKPLLKFMNTPSIFCGRLSLYYSNLCAGILPFLI